MNYTMFRIARNAFFTVRNEYMNDRVGARTGFATQYSEHAIGLTYWPDKIITIRPELRFDHSYDYPRTITAATEANSRSLPT